jgi:redox-sensitive bicupin YhaK (pirin superfamily)
MLKKISNKNLYCGDYEWHVCRHHFSFAEYHDPENMNFGVLRALNDDIIQPSHGFTPHPHDNMEIISYCVSGQLSHNDDMGNKHTLEPGDVQYLCAGSGIVHSEMNGSHSQGLRFIQIWITPDRKELNPNYSNKSFPVESRQNRLMKVASGNGTDGSIRINQDADVLVSELETGKSINYSLPKNRQTYLLCIEGSIRINDLDLQQHEAMEIVDQTDLTINAIVKSHVLMVEMSRTA